jgi:hypothetical protein
MWQADRLRGCLYNKVVLPAITISHQEDRLKAIKNEAGDQKLKALEAPVLSKFMDYSLVMKT